MPKKRQPAYAAFASGPTAGPSGAAGSTSTSATQTDAPRSVNDLLTRLRREQAPKATAQHASQISAVLSSRSVPPHLRHLMNIPETAPPPPRPGARGVRIRDRRVAGPAPPRSWLEGSGSMHAPAVDGREQPGRRSRPRDLRWLSRRRDRPPAANHVPSLAETALKCMARHWDELVVYEQLNIATLPIPLKSDLLTYLTIYGPDHGIPLSSLKTIFLKESELPGATGSEEVSRLNLSALVGHQFSLKDFERYCTREAPQDTAKIRDALHSLNLSTEEQTPEEGRSAAVAEASSAAVSNEEVADSWEEEAGSLSSLPRPLHTFRFPCLTHLSLSHPGPSISWSHLLSLSSHLATLTDLSLAYWPAPSLTPNSQTTTVVTSHSPSPVNLGGTGFYSASDGDWNEAATLLRKLSKSTYSLRRLDLEGCGEWLPALTAGFNNASSLNNTAPGQRPLQHHPPIALNAHTAAQRRNAWNDDTAQWANSASHVRGPDWNGAWRLIEHVNISQGWVPGDYSIVRGLPSGPINCELLGWLRQEHEEIDPEKLTALRQERGHSAPIRLCQRPDEVRKWLDREKEARKVATEIRRLRSEAKGGWCTFDHGWSAPGGIGGRRDVGPPIS